MGTPTAIAADDLAPGIDPPLGRFDGLTARAGAHVPDVRMHEGTRHDGEGFALVTWWASPQELRFGELTEQGPAFSVEALTAPGNASYPQSLVEQAVRAVRER